MAERFDVAALRRAVKALRPLEALVQPAFFGLERAPARGPALYVGNHSLYGIFDAPFLYARLLTERGVALRALGDHLHFKVPLWSGFVTAMGVVDGTRENCAALFRAGESVLVFPGGARETAKRKHERYRLVWKERTGFARMAIEHGAAVVPFAAVGVEDAWDVVLDADDVMRGPVRRAVESLGMRSEVMLPLARGIGPTPLPRPERLYFDIGEPIEVSRWAGRHDDPTACRELRDQTRAAVEAGIARLRDYQSTDPDRPLRRRLARALRGARGVTPR